MPSHLRRLATIALAIVVVGCYRETPRWPVTPDFSNTAPTPPATPATRYPALSGIVKDASTGKPLAAVAVLWIRPMEFWGDRGHGVKTNAEGYYITHIPPFEPDGHHNRILVRAEKAGYNPQETDLAIAEDTELNFALAPMQP